MNVTSGHPRSGSAVLAASCAWAILILAGYPLAAFPARAQSTPSTTTLQGGVQQNSTTGDVFQGGDPTNTNQPGVGGPACQQIDPECGGTSRQCYNQAYHSTGIVMSVAKSQSLYQQTGGQIWIRCGTCRSNVICWPRPGYQDLIAGRASGGGPGPGQSGVPGGQGGPPSGGTGRAPMPGPAGGIGYVPGSDPCKPQGPGGYDYCNNGPGARLPPGCFCGGAPDPNLAGYVDSHGETPAGDRRSEGQPSATGVAGRPDPGTPNYTVNGKPVQVDNGHVTIPGGAEDTGSVQGADRSPIRIGGVQQPGYWNPGRPFYNGKYTGPLGDDLYTIDVAKEQGNVQNPREITDRHGAKRTGIVIPNFEPSGYMHFMWLITTQEKVNLEGVETLTFDRNALTGEGNIVDQNGKVVLNEKNFLSKLQAWASNVRSVAAPKAPKFVGY